MKVVIGSLDRMFSKYIRLRAMARVHGCERCGTWKSNYIELQCSHFHGRVKKSVRYDEDNASGLCFGCHQYFTSHPLEHVEFFNARLGPNSFDMLAKRAQTPQKLDYEAVRLYLIAKINEVDGEVLR